MSTQNSLVTRTVTRDEAKRESLQKVIRKKRQQLTRLLTKTETLRVELDMVRQEYDVRVGSLYLKDNQLDIEIIYFKNIIQLMGEGVSYKDAVERLNDTFYAKQRAFEKERERMRQEEKIYTQRSESESQHMGDELKKMWKSLVAKFHPDLVQDKQEKKKREEMMKQINRAYEEYNYEQLKKFENAVAITEYPESTVENLEDILVEIENQIIQQEIAYQELRTSEWYAWKVKLQQTKRKGIDIFANMERTLLNTVVRKMDILKDLKAQVPELNEDK